MYKHLIEYTEKNRYALHMPGHKRNPEFQMANPYGIDMTEVDGMDNLHHPEEMIRDSMNRIKRRYKTEESYFLVGGSTCGILAAVSACCRKGSAVLVDRGCHRSVYHALYLLGLKPVYLLPEIEKKHGFSLGISVEEVQKKMSGCGQKISAAVLTSPTYEGIVSDVRAIAELLHKEEIPLIVDEAHGAHFPWMYGKVDGMPESAVSQGADLVVQSVHKTLPALTQTALLHVCTRRVLPEKIEWYLNIYETSSPSYVLLASLDQCMNYLSHKGNEAFAHYGEMLADFRQRASDWQVLKLWEYPLKEPSKLVISTGIERAGEKAAVLTGPELADILRKKYGFEVEMEAATYILAMTSVADTRAGLMRFADALEELDSALAKKMEVRAADASDMPNGAVLPEEPEVCMDAYEAANEETESVLISESSGRISAEYVMVYPPGIPFLVPGEKVTGTVIKKIAEAKEKKLHLLGLADKQAMKIRVLKKDE
jgi:arginine/lysine/ornithine decarboxylase